jgi:hypothetical protein
VCAAEVAAAVVSVVEVPGLPCPRFPGPIRSATRCHLLDAHEKVVLLLHRNVLKPDLDDLAKHVPDVAERHRSDIQQSIADAILMPFTPKAQEFTTSSYPHCLALRGSHKHPKGIHSIDQGFRTPASRSVDESRASSSDVRPKVLVF